MAVSFPTFSNSNDILTAIGLTSSRVPVQFATVTPELQANVLQAMMPHSNGNGNPLQSTVMRNFSYNPVTNKVMVKFDFAAQPYAYFAIPPVILSNWLKSNSLGAYWNKNIRGRYY